MRAATGSDRPVAALAPPRRENARLLLLALGLAALGWLLWHLRPVVILLFGAVLTAVLLCTLAQPLERRFGLGHRSAVMLTVLGLVLVLALGGWAVGDRLADELDRLRAVLPRSLEALMQWLHTHRIGIALLDWWRSVGESEAAWTRLVGVANLAGETILALGSALLLLVTGIYLAAEPTLYRRGLVRLLPPARREPADRALRAAGAALSRWLLGQSVSMLAIGTLTTIGLSLLGMQLALALGAIAFVLAFVPVFGAVASGVLITLLAFVDGPRQALNAALVCLAIQQIEELLLQPVIQRWAVSLPPALGLLGGVAFALLFGVLGVVFATPLLVVVMVLVQRLHVDAIERGTL